MMIASLEDQRMSDEARSSCLVPIVVIIILFFLLLYSMGGWFTGPGP